MYCYWFGIISALESRLLCHLRVINNDDYDFDVN